MSCLVLSRSAEVYVFLFLGVILDTQYLCHISGIKMSAEAVETQIRSFYR